MLLLVGGFLIQTVDTYITWPKYRYMAKIPHLLWMFSKKGHMPHALFQYHVMYRRFTWKATWQVDIGRCPYGSLHASPSIASVPTKPDAWLQFLEP